jgi:hypothetical protein
VLKPCRACGHKVDTSALACPGCGATDPAKKISRQERDFYFSIVHTIVWICALGVFGWSVWKFAIPRFKQMLDRPAAVMPALPSTSHPASPPPEELQDNE